MSESLPEALRRIAQNDYIIDVSMLPDGRVMEAAADRIESLERELAEAKAEILELAKALGTTYEPDQGPVYAGTLTDMLTAIHNREAEVERLRALVPTDEENAEVVRLKQEYLRLRQRIPNPDDLRALLYPDRPYPFGFPGEARARLRATLPKEKGPS